MKFTSNKNQILNMLEDLYLKLQDKDDVAKVEHEIKNQEKKKSWESACQEAKDNYLKLPKNWWEQFIEEESYTQDNLFFKTEKKYKTFDDLSATVFLIEKRLYIFGSFNPLCNHYLRGAKILRDDSTVGEFSVSVQSLGWDGVLRDRVENYYIKLLDESILYEYKSFQELGKIHELIVKIKTIPDYVSDVVLEEDDIALIKSAKGLVEKE